MSEEFNIFWEAYPRKVGKGSARKAFAKALKLAPLEKILSAVEEQSLLKQWNRKNESGELETQWIPHPATWLNDERWENQHRPEEFISIVDALTVEDAF